MSEQKIIYLGMADDIMAPLLLVPKFETLYVIDLFDSCFSSDKTWESQKDNIREILFSGNDACSYKRKDYSDPHFFSKNLDEIHYLNGPSNIISDYDDGIVWKLSFIYDHKKRDLIYYHHRNFLVEWPNEIVDVGHVMVIGSFSWDQFEKEYIYNDDPSVLIKMLEFRTNTPFLFYASHFNHKHFTETVTIKHGSDQHGSKISILQIQDTKNKGWIRQMYHPEYLNGSKTIEDFQ